MDMVGGDVGGGSRRRLLAGGVSLSGGVAAAGADACGALDLGFFFTRLELARLEVSRLLRPEADARAEGDVGPAGAARGAIDERDCSPPRKEEKPPRSSLVVGVSFSYSSTSDQPVNKDTSRRNRYFRYFGYLGYCGYFTGDGYLRIPVDTCRYL